ncbi:hypothetical protein M8044_000550 [Columbia Basin potato purple top phytoplasma]|uniref:Uncharacterized protein n=1 Tax=Columbia Basin potato purple top phytoplasma TaxID=307134 RepID=A0ABT5LCS2_9MOLU|nr:hypothetical protein [Columbia Basin potato purple top phytoplasma]
MHASSWSWIMSDPMRIFFEISMTFQNIRK